jgi:acetyltransferase-like isoleucine patch superfamily enzyme
MIASLVSYIISTIKGEDWKLSREIPSSYLVSLSVGKFLMLLRGYLCFFRFKKVILIGSNTIIKCKSKIYVYKNIQIGNGCYIDALSIAGIQFGNNVSIGKSTTIECTGSLKQLGVGLEVGNNVGLGSHGFFGCAGGVKIGDDCIFGNYVSFHSENHNYDEPVVPIRLQGVTRKGIVIGKNCWLGAKATILDGVVLGPGSIVAAGAVVRAGEYPANVILGGVPAKILKKRIPEKNIVSILC